jgi:undecaprenyl diphosphate synthase
MAPLAASPSEGGSTEELLAEVRRGPVPSHIAIVMDGNGRWAAKRGLPRVMGHRAGAKAVREAITAAAAAGVSYLTLYTFSTENWNRSTEEVGALMGLFAEMLEREIDELDRQQVRLLTIGELGELPQATRRAFEDGIARTAANKGLSLVIAVNYGGRQEIVRAARLLAEEGIDPAAIDEGVFAAHLWTHPIPDPELLIRTSGEYRLSNFLLFQAAYSELWITRTLWPDFRRRHLYKAVLDFRARQRRFGGV